MKIFLAGGGGVTGNLNEYWKNNIFLAEATSRKEVRESMNIFLAGGNGKKTILSERLQNSDFLKDDGLKEINILESFYYLRKNPEFMILVKQFGLFLLDSGAFTFMQGSHKGSINWDDYVEEYAAFINHYDIQLFFELDIDSIIGLMEVERLRHKLETLTGKKPIPVWHKNRGKEYFIKMCEEYPYVALGGIAIKEIERKRFETFFPWFIKTAHDHGCKIHGLGYTNIANLKLYHFDSVDSTAWLYGNRGGYLYRFNPSTGLMEQLNKAGCRLKTKEGAVNNFNEWVKFSKYASIYL